MKRLLALIITLAMVVSLFAACGNKAPASSQTPESSAPSSEPSTSDSATPEPAPEIGGKVVVWSFTDELQKMIDGHLKKDLPNIEIEFVLTPNDVYQSKLKPVLQSGQDAPDVFALESAYFKAYLDTGWMLDLSDMEEKAKAAGMLQYPIDACKDKTGKIRAYSWQGTPGAMFYRRSLAKQYLGTDEPAKVQEFFKDPATFLQTAQVLFDKSGGKTKVCTNGDLFNVFKAARSQAWVVDNKLVIDPAMDQLIDLQKTLKDKKFDNGASPWDASWFAGINGTLKDEKGNPVETFSYFLPTWGLHYVLKTNCEVKENDQVKGTTAGDWAMIKGPFSYFWGGTFVGVYANSKNPDAAKAVVEYLTMNEKFLEAWAKETGDFVSSMNVVNRIKDTYSEPFLAGQNHYAAFAEMATGINASTLTGYDQEIDKFFQDEMALYIKGEKSKDEALKSFKTQVANQFPDITVE